MAVAVRGLACGKRESSDNVAPLPAALVRRGDRRLLHGQGRERAGLAYVYFEEESGRRAAAKLLTRDEDSPTWVVVQLDQARSGTEKSGNSRMRTIFSVILKLSKLCEANRTLATLCCVTTVFRGEIALADTDAGGGRWRFAGRKGGLPGGAP